jgi:hypothetical protein
MKRIHDLKCHPDVWGPMRRGDKPFEIRFNDRNFQVGDGLLLRFYSPETQTYNGDWTLARVIYVLTDTKYGMKDGYVIMAVEQVSAGSSDHWKYFPHIVASILPVSK